MALDPRGSPFDPQMIIPLVGAIQFAAYDIITRIAARHDSVETSFFWTGIVGAAGMSLVVPLAFSPLQGNDWIWMAALCLTSTGGRFMLIKAFDVAEASVLQPFPYNGVVTLGVFGFLFFADPLMAVMLTGGGIADAAGLLTFWRERVQTHANEANTG